MREIETVAKVLGVASPKAPVDLVATVEHGLPFRSLYRISEMLAPDDASFKYRIVPKASLARRKHANRLSASQSAVVARLAGIWAQAMAVWQDESDARDFLIRPHQLLGGKRPLELAIANEIGARLVEELLGRIQSGVAV